MGTSMVQVGNSDAGHIYGVGSGGPYYATCQQYGTYALFQWSGGAWTPINQCLNQLSVGQEDGYLMEVSLGGIYGSANNFQTQTVYATSGYKFVRAMSATDACAVTTGDQLQQLTSGNTFVPVATQPGTGVVGCAMTDDGFMYAWGSFGNRIYDFGAHAWTTISGGGNAPAGWPPSRGIVSITPFQRASTLALNNYGLVEHLNVYAGTISGITRAW